jgi:hypothetical protein
MAIATTLALNHPYFAKYFYLYTFASNYSLVVAFTRKDEEGSEFPISFISRRLQGIELNYLMIQK